MSLQLKNFDIENSMKHESLETRYKGSIEELESQKRRFMDQIEQVSRRLQKSQACFEIPDSGKLMLRAIIIK